MHEKSQFPTDGENVPGPIMEMEHGFYCPAKGVEGTFHAAFPALEICPNCKSPKGRGAGQCNFLVLPGDLHPINSGMKRRSKPELPQSFTSEFNIGDTVKTVGTEESVV